MQTPYDRGLDTGNSLNAHISPTYPVKINNIWIPSHNSLLKIPRNPLNGIGHVITIQIEVKGQSV
jgi:hypothetical protein